MTSDLKSLRQAIMDREVVTKEDLVRIIDVLESSIEETISNSKRYADGKVKALDDRLKRIEPPKTTLVVEREGEYEVFDPNG
ncbi:hypothetical protein LCGC14_1461070 [marine sediment metagenome]|uniref:Uncharacterized protein n=1 Tax=marine sediment metagenome TaxID=412755 RepID=A0A0F9JF30_9ZZZZ